MIEQDKGKDEFVDQFKTTFRFKRKRDYPPGESWILLVYGPSKTGKTFFSGTAGSRTLYLNIGDGFNTLLAPAFTSKYGAISDDMIVVDVRESKDAAEAFNNVCRAIDEALEKFPHLFDTVVMDEATAFRKYALNAAVDANQRKSGGVRSRIDTFTKAEIDDYGTEMAAIEWFLGKYVPIFKEHKKHFIMLAHERQIFNKAAKIGDEQTLKKVMPGFTGKTFPDNVPAYFDDVWHSETYKAGDKVFYQLRTAGSDAMTAGSRHGGVFKLEERDPNFLSMLQRIRDTHTSI